MKLRVALLFLLASLCVQPGISAQGIGDRIRLVTLAGDTLVGHVAEIDPQMILVDLDESETRRQVQRDQVGQLDMHAGVRNYKWWGMLVGGVAIGGITALAMTEEVPDCPPGHGFPKLFDWDYEIPPCPTKREPTPAGAVFMLSGYVLGYFGGRMIQRDRWITIPPDDSAVAPLLAVRRYSQGHSAIRLGVRIRF